MSEPQTLGEAAEATVTAIREKWEAAGRPTPTPDGWAPKVPATAYGTPRRFTEASLADFDTVNALAAIGRWWDDGRRQNVLISGPVGTGKTHLAVALARATTLPSLFCPVVEVLDAMRPGGDETMSPNRLQNVACLVLDDLGAEKPTDWTADRLYAIVNRRWMEKRITIVTTNLRLGELPSNTISPDKYLQHTVGERLYSRLADDAVGVVLSGTDRRRA
jgi:DNA replication protein DnaC